MNGKVVGETIEDITNTGYYNLVDSLDSYGAEFTFEFIIDINDAIDTEAPLFGEGLNNYDKRLYSDSDNIMQSEKQKSFIRYFKLYISTISPFLVNKYVPIFFSLKIYHFII